MRVVFFTVYFLGAKQVCFSTHFFRWDKSGLFSNSVPPKVTEGQKFSSEPLFVDPPRHPPPSQPPGGTCVGWFRSDPPDLKKHPETHTSLIISSPRNSTHHPNPNPNPSFYIPIPSARCRRFIFLCFVINDTSEDYIRGFFEKHKDSSGNKLITSLSNFLFTIHRMSQS